MQKIEGFLTANTIREIREEFINQKFTDYALYDIYKFYFDGIDKENKKLGIPKYNGGLFAKDDILDGLRIDDDVLDTSVQTLSNYDFMSDISVNILGHIFERSLTDLEEMNARLNDIGFDNSQSKRKKDGVFYTPEYITEYIIDNTLGKLCREKKEELGVAELIAPRNPKKPTKQERETKRNLDTYREWLLNLKILDPACGSGAFLNQALEFLMLEHLSLQKDLVVMGDIMAYYEIETSILENNLYGVDINEDAVEIAKLSLWLRTATKGRELTTLANKIKCGNSLINDKNINNNFVWEEEFSEVFTEGGFDIVIGNPPYVRNTSLPQEDKKVYDANYFVADKQYDLYVLFNELAIKLTKKDGLIGFIQPNKFLSADYGLNTVNYILHNSEIILIKDVSLDKTFEDASVYPYIFIFKKKSADSDIEVKNISIFDVCKESRLIGFDKELKSINIIHKINHLSQKLSSISSFIKRGVPNSKLEFSLNGKYNAIASADLSFPYSAEQPSRKIDYIDQNYEKTKNDEFAQPLILFPRTVFTVRAILTEEHTHILDRIYYVSLSDDTSINIKTILTLLNSKITTFYYNYFYGSTKIGGGYMDLKGTQISNFPILKNIKNEQALIKKADLLIELYRSLQKAKQNFINELGLEKISKKLQSFEELDFEEFVKEYKKNKKLKFIDKLEERNFKNEWRTLFENDRKDVLDLKQQIDTNNKEINTMVYKLYEFTDEEITLIENM